MVACEPVERLALKASQAWIVSEDPAKASDDNNIANKISVLVLFMEHLSIN